MHVYYDTVQEELLLVSQTNLFEGFNSILLESRSGFARNISSHPIPLRDFGPYIYLGDL